MTKFNIKVNSIDVILLENTLIHIKPFKGLRPAKKFCSNIVSLPYDVLTLDEIQKIVKNNPLSLYRIIRSEVDFDNIDPYSDEVYNKAKENFNDFINKGYLHQDDTPCFYLYSEKKNDYQQIGLIGNILAEDYEKNIVRKHENTRIEKVNDRIKHIDTVNAQTGLVFLTYKSNKVLNAIINECIKNEPEYNFKTDDDILHTFWKINDLKIISSIIEVFNDISNLYIADGHHRANAAINISNKYRKDAKAPYNEKNYIMSIIYSHDSLRILPYNRVVKDTKLSYEEIMNKIKINFTVEVIESNEKTNGFIPKSQKEIGMYLEGKWHILKVKKSIITGDPISSLDVSLLQNYILKPIFNINDPRTDKNMDFIGGNKDTLFLKELVDSNKFKIAFSMYPTSIEQLFAVADEEKLMPPKSTWFDPKPRSGFVIHLLD